MFLLWQILPAAAIAMMTAAAIRALALVFGQEGSGRIVGALAVGFGFAAGQLFITGWVSFPPTDTTNWLPYFAVTGAILGGIVAAIGLNTPVRLLLFALLSVAALKLLLKPKFQYAWSPTVGWIWVICLTMGFVVFALSQTTLVRRSATPIEIPTVWLILCAGTFTALLLSGSVLLGQLASVLGAAIFGWLVFSWRGRDSGDGILLAFSLLHLVLLVSGYFFASLPASSAALLALAPIPALFPIRSRNAALNLGLRAGSVLIPVAAAVALAYFSSPPLDY